MIYNIFVGILHVYIYVINMIIVDVQTETERNLLL